MTTDTTTNQSTGPIQTLAVTRDAEHKVAPPDDPFAGPIEDLWADDDTDFDFLTRTKRPVRANCEPDLGDHNPDFDECENEPDHCIDDDERQDEITAATLNDSTPHPLNDKPTPPEAWAVEWDSCDCGGGYPCHHAGFPVAIIGATSQLEIARLSDYNGDPTVADAYLLAAAPDLRDACEAIERSIPEFVRALGNGCDLNVLGRALKSLREGALSEVSAALAKARGIDLGVPAKRVEPDETFDPWAEDDDIPGLTEEQFLAKCDPDAELEPDDHNNDPDPSDLYTADDEVQDEIKAEIDREHDAYETMRETEGSAR